MGLLWDSWDCSQQLWHGQILHAAYLLPGSGPAFLGCAAPEPCSWHPSWGQAAGGGPCLPLLLLGTPPICQVCGTSYSRGQYNVRNGTGACPTRFPWWDVPEWTLNYTASNIRWKRNFILGKCTCKSTTANMGSSEGVKENNHWASLLNGSYECTSSNFLKP